HPLLKDLLATAPGVDEINTFDDPLPQASAAIWTMSLPHRFGKILSDVPYLHHDPARVAKFSDVLDRASHKLHVGVVWKGNPKHPDDRLRSIALATLAPLAQTPGVQFVSLQKEAGDDRPMMTQLGWIDLNPRLENFADLAAAMSLLDLVITVDTAA